MEYAIVDIETTGSFAAGNRITEIAIVIHNGRHVLEKFESLVNPEIPIPRHIQALTGIEDDTVEDAPKFASIAAKVYDMLHKRVFVAHNANFDYSFLVKELHSAGYKWQAAKLCTVRLARKIIPNIASYSLGKLCHHLGIPITNRHRAMGDTEATVKLFELLIQHDAENVIETTLRKTKEHRLPTHIDQEDFLRLPETAGVYFFRDQRGKIIYIGKAINIKRRVLSHFSGNNGSSRRQAFINDIRSIDFEESGTEMMALLMECKLIKIHWPIHNRALKKYEPKFALISYEDQAGFLRLAVTQFRKNMEAVRCFERASDANQFLLQLISEFELDNRLCTFYAPSADNQRGIRAHELPTNTAHNARIQQALNKVTREQKSFVLLDHGRHLDEKSYIYYRHNQLHAFGFLDVSNQIHAIEDIIAEDDLCSSNYYMNSLVIQYASRFPSKVHHLGASDHECYRGKSSE